MTYYQHLIDIKRFMRRVPSKSIGRNGSKVQRSINRQQIRPLGCLLRLRLDPLVEARIDYSMKSQKQAEELLYSKMSRFVFPLPLKAEEMKRSLIIFNKFINRSKRSDNET